MLVLNGQVFYNRRFQALDLRILGDKIVELRPRGAFASKEAAQTATAYPGEDLVDAKGLLVLPGLTDIHTHGAVRADFSDGDLEGLRRIQAYQAGVGVTQFCPTSMTLGLDRLGQIFQGLQSLSREDSQKRKRSQDPGRPQEEKRECSQDPEGNQAQKLTPEGNQNPEGSQDLGRPQEEAQGQEGSQNRARPQGAEILGIHMEGPYISPAKLGAQNPAYVLQAQYEDFARLAELSGHRISLVSLAPEMPGALDFIRQAAGETLISVAHTQATYDQALAAFEAGARHLTHMFNAMPGLHHREPGPIAAARDCPEVTVELIGDGVHIHPAMVRLAFALFPGRVCLVSDSMRATGLGAGEYDLGGQTVWVKGKEARLAQGALAGSVTNLADVLRTVYAMGIPLEEAVYAATACPAQAIGQGQLYGSLAAGAYANFILADEALTFQAIYIRGQKHVPSPTSHEA